MMDIGPYMNGDGDWWVPVEAAGFKAARREIVSCLQYLVPEEGTLVYIGKEMAWLGGEGEEEDPDSHYVLAYHFEERER
jgi:hypothetical protein